MATEPFLENPPKHLPKSKRYRENKASRRHRILAIERKGGGLFTSSKAKIVRKGVKINPFRKNPFGESLMFIGANPFKEVSNMSMRRHRRRVHRNPKKRHHKRHYRMFSKNPARSHRRHRHHYRRNPVTNLINFKVLGMGAIGALATRMVPNLLNLSGYMDYAAKLAILLVGGFGASKVVGKDAAEGFMVGSGAILVTDVVKNALTGNLANAPVVALPAPTAVAGFEQVSGFEQRTALGAMHDDPYARVTESAY